MYNKFELNELFLEIKKSYVEKKYNKVVRDATKYLESDPNNVKIRFMRAKSYRRLNLFNEAINDLKYNLKIDDNSHSLLELYCIYYYLNMYKEALNLLPIMYEKRCINAYSVSISELVMKKQLGIDIRLKKDVKCDYIRGQIFNYSTTDALNHIEYKHLNGDPEKVSLFNKDINLNYLYETVRNNIKNSNKVNCDEIMEIYYYGISNIGYSANTTCNFIKVVVVPNTNNIISMYPTDNIDSDSISNIDIDYNLLFNKKEEKVKKLSQTERFNNRFKRV